MKYFILGIGDLFERFKINFAIGNGENSHHNQLDKQTKVEPKRRHNLKFF